MPASTSTTRQDHVAAVQTLVNQGVAKSDALKTVAQQHGVAVGTVRGACYRAAAGDGSARKPATPIDPVEQARAIFETALANVDAEIDQLKTAADEATAAYRAAKEGAAAKRADLRKRIASLS
jgi:hypothetical protein